MKKVYFIFIIILCSVNVFAQDDENTITIDSPVYEGGLLVHTPKSYLLNPYMEGNVFNIIYQDPEKWDVVKRRALEYATKIWEENMQTAYPRINIQVNFQNFNNTTTATRTKIHTYDNVVEAPLNLDENTAIPGSIVKRYFNMGQYLCYIDEDIPNQLDQNIDISISFNDKEDLFYWNTDGRTDSDKLDFVTIALREIAKGLGFFSGVRKVGVNQFTTHHYDKVYPLDLSIKDQSI